MKLIVDGKTDKVLGAAMIGPDAAEIIQGLAIAIKCGATKKHFDSTVSIPPASIEMCSPLFFSFASVLAPSFRLEE